MVGFVCAWICVCKHVYLSMFAKEPVSADHIFILVAMVVPVYVCIDV